MEISMELIKELRSRTGAGVMDAKNVLAETNGDLEKAIEELRKRGQKVAAKKSDRPTGEGIIDCYIHSNGKLAGMVELACETDFVARNSEFRELAHDLAMHVAAADPQYLTKDDVPADVVEREKQVIMEQLKTEGKPENVMEKIAEGKLQKFYEQVCLMEQVFIKDDKKTIADLVNSSISKIGENIKIQRFVRWVLGQ